MKAGGRFRSAAGSERKRGRIASPQAVAEAKLLLDRDYFTALLDGIDRARAEIFLSAYLFRTIEDARGYPEAVLKRLLAAVERGVRVDVILERNQNADDLNRNNAETAERLKQGGIRVCMDAPDRVTHTKLVVIDRRYRPDREPQPDAIGPEVQPRGLRLDRFGPAGRRGPELYEVPLPRRVEVKTAPR